MAPVLYLCVVFQSLQPQVYRQWVCDQSDPVLWLLSCICVLCSRAYSPKCTANGCVTNQTQFYGSCLVFVSNEKTMCRELIRCVDISANIRTVDQMVIGLVDTIGNIDLIGTLFIYVGRTGRVVFMWTHNACRYVPLKGSCFQNRAFGTETTQTRPRRPGNKLFDEHSELTCLATPDIITSVC